MNPTHANAIAEFLRDGGRILRVAEAIRATEEEILDYLASCGVKVKFAAGDLKCYLCENKRYSLEGLVRLANSHRREEQLSPFMAPIKSRPVWS